MKLLICFVMPSFREGLSRSIMETMASSLPCIVSRIRGNVDLIEEGKGRFLCDPDDLDAFAVAIDSLCKAMSQFNMIKIKKFDVSVIKKNMRSIYAECLGEKMKKKVVLIRSNSVSPDPPVEKMASTLLKEGYNVTIIGWDREANHPLTKDKVNLSGHAVDVIRFGIKAQFGGGIKKNLMPLLNFQKCVRRWLLKNQSEYDIIHAFDFDTGLVASKCAKTFNKKLVYHILDYYADSHRFRETVLKKIIIKLENSVINFADATVICTEKRKEQIAGSYPKNLVVIHNTPQQIPFSQDLKLQIHDGCDARKKIAYVGILDEGRFIRELIEFVKQKKQFELHIGGFGPLASEIEQIAKTNNSVFYYGRLPYSSTLALEEQCDLMVAIYDPSIPNHQYAAPNKFYESIMLGKPIIMAKNTGFDDIIMQNEIGCCIDYTNQGLADGILFLLDNAEKWESMGSRGRALYNDSFSWTVMEKRIKDMYGNIE